jgi:hypothetical protein
LVKYTLSHIDNQYIFTYWKSIRNKVFFYIDNQCVIKYILPRCICWFTWWQSWLRHCATSWKVVGSIPYCVIGIFHWHNSSDCTVVLELTQTITEISTRNISCGVKRQLVPRADNLTTFMRRLSGNLGASAAWNPRACTGIALLIAFVGLLCIRTLCYIICKPGCQFCSLV